VCPAKLSSALLFEKVSGQQNLDLSDFSKKRDYPPADQLYKWWGFHTCGP